MVINKSINSPKITIRWRTVFDISGFPIRQLVLSCHHLADGHNPHPAERWAWSSDK